MIPVGLPIVLKILIDRIMQPLEDGQVMDACRKRGAELGWSEKEIWDAYVNVSREVKDRARRERDEEFRPGPEKAPDGPVRACSN